MQFRRMNDSRDMQDLFDAVPDAVLLADDERRYVHANPAACDLMGLPAEELLGRRIEEFADLDPAAVEAMWAEFLVTGELSGHFVVKRPDGTRRLTDFHARAGFRPGVHASFLRDITDRVVPDDIWSVQLALVDCLAEPRSLRDSMEAALELVVRLGWDVANLWVPGPDGKVLHWFAGAPKDMRGASAGLTFGSQDGMIGRVWQRGEPEWIDDVSGHDAFLRTIAFEDAGLRTVVGVPLRVGDRTVGVLDLASHESRPFDLEPLARVQRLTPTLALALAQYRQTRPVAPELEALQRSLSRLASGAPADVAELKKSVDIVDRLLARVRDPSQDAGMAGPQPPVTGVQGLAVLTPREREIVVLIAEGNTSAQIATRLGISRRTVDTHRTNINRKLGVRSVASLTQMAIRHGLLDVSTSDGSSR